VVDVEETRRFDGACTEDNVVEEEVVDVADTTFVAVGD
jgi:hypothetical protein